MNPYTDFGFKLLFEAVGIVRFMETERKTMRRV